MCARSGHLVEQSNRGGVRATRSIGDCYENIGVYKERLTDNLHRYLLCQAVGSFLIPRNLVEAPRTEAGEQARRLSPGYEEARLARSGDEIRRVSLKPPTFPAARF